MASNTVSDTGDDDLATAIGRYVLGDVSLGNAAERAGMTRWEFEDTLSGVGFRSLYGPRTDEQLQRELDTVRGNDETE